MPSIEILGKYVAISPSSKWQEIRIFTAGNGAKAVFRDPYEFRMGANAWFLEVFTRDSKKQLTKSGLDVPLPYQPWSHESGHLFLSNWRTGPYLVEVASDTSTPCDLKQLPITALGSQRFPRFLVVTSEMSCLMGLDGRVERVLPFPNPASSKPHLHWFDAAGQFIAVENHGAGRAAIRFFTWQGDPVDTIPIDPITVFPYEETKYRGLRRDSFSLAISESVLCVGSLLDEWSAVEFQKDTGILRMRVYRPAGEIYEWQRQSVCKAEEHFVELRLRG